MAYTTAQLVATYTNTNLGKAPDAATTLLLEAYASQTSTGALTDGQALDRVIDLADGTTAVAITTYQFFSGKTPSKAGLDFLVNSATNTSDLNDPYYAKFANENRYINFAVNLGADKASDYTKSFEAAYGTLTFAQVVAVAYEKIIGTAAATAAGINVPNAIAYLSRAENEAYLKSFIKTYAPNVNQDLGVKAAVIGTIMSAALTYDVGAYASSTEKMLIDLADDGKAASADPVDLLVAYPPTIVVPPASALTKAVDTINGTSSADFYQAVYNTADATFTNLDAIDGAGGNDTLTLVDADGTGYADPAGVSIKNIEVLNVQTATGTSINTTGALASIGNINVTGNGSVTVTSSATQVVTVTNVSAASTDATVTGGASQVITAAGDVTSSGSKGAVTVVDAFTGSDLLNVQDGGGAVSATATASTGGNQIVLGNVTGIKGAVTVNESLKADDTTGSYTDGTTYVQGGTTVALTSTVANTSSTTTNTVTQGSFQVVGTKDTTSVTVGQAAALTGVAKVDAVTAVREVASVKFAALTTGETVTLAGLTYTSTGASTAAEVASAFANLLKVGATGGATNGTTKGTFTGTTAGWTTGPASGDTVTFTSSAAGVVADLTDGGTNVLDVTISTTQGVAAVTGVAAAGGVATGAVTVTDAGVLGTDAGTISSISLTNFSGATLQSNALTTLNLAGVGGTASVPIANGNVSIASGAGSKVDVLDLTLTATNSGTVADSNGNYTTLNVTTAGAAGSTLAGLTAGAAKTVNLAGTQVLTLTSAAGLSVMETLKISGAAGLRASSTASSDLSGIASLKSVDASGTSGAVSVIIDATAATYTGGTGVDSVTIKAAPTKAIAGGSGTDVLTVNFAGGYNPSSNALITGFETLALGSTATGTYDATGFTAVRTGAVAAAVKFSNVAAGTGLTISASPTQIVTYELKDATGLADSLAVTLTGTATVDATGIETVTVASSSTLGGTAASLTLTDLDATSVKISGNNSVTLGTGANAKITTVDGSGLIAGAGVALGLAVTGNLTYATDTDNTGANVKVTVTGGAGADTLTANGQGDTLIGGAGADTLTTNANQVTLTGGAGADKFVINATPTSLNQYSTITDATAGDVLVFKTTAGAETFNFTKVTLAPTAGFQDFADAAVQAGGNAAVNEAFGWFQFGGDTYVVLHDGPAAATFQNGVDTVVKLAGLVDLSLATFSNLGGGTAVSGEATFVLG